MEWVKLEWVDTGNLGATVTARTTQRSNIGVDGCGAVNRTIDHYRKGPDCSSRRLWQWVAKERSGWRFAIG